MDTHSAIDHFVVRMRERGEVIRPLASAPWIAHVEQRLGLHFPPSFRSLIGRYAFPVLDLGLVELFANEGDGAEYDLTTAPFRDAFMSPWLITHRLIYIGHPHIGDYDPVCFDLSNQELLEPPIVKLNHEDILLERPTVRRRVLADSFLALVEQA